RLTSEYLVDMYSRVEEECLNYILNEKKRLNKERNQQRQPNVKKDFENKDNQDESDLRLSASFLGSKKWYSVYVANALALARCREKPSFFITITTNLNWEEIKLQLRTPYAHIVMSVNPKLPVDQIDKIIFAELSRENIQLRELIKKFMLHKQNHSSRCLRNRASNISQYSCLQNISSTTSLLTHYLLRPLDSLFNNLKYTEYYEQFILYPFKQEEFKDRDFLKQEQPQIPRKIVRKRTTDKITRIVLISSEASLRTINGITYRTYQETACEMGLFTVDNEGIFAMKEAIENFYTPAKLYIQEQFPHNNCLTNNITLQKIAYMITEYRRHIRDFRLPEPQILTQEIALELQHRKAKQDKTFLINAICHAIRAESKIVLPCGTTALAAQLYEGERTAYSLFHIPVEEYN
ncbi:34302_t:CDS:2, partial [Racocetra persica]